MDSPQQRKPSLPSIKNLLDMAPRVDDYRPIHDPSPAEGFDVLYAGAQPVHAHAAAYRSDHQTPPAVQWNKGYGYSAADHRRSSALSPPSSPEASSMTDSYGSSTSPRSSVSYSPRPSISAQQYEQQQQNYYAQPLAPQQRGYAPYPPQQPHYYPPPPPPQHGHAIMAPPSPIVDQRRMSSVPAPIANTTSPSVQLASNRYQCPYCPKRFSRPSSLRIHTFSHTGEKPFCCPVPGCGRKFSVQSNMRRHLRVHRGQKE